MKFKLIEGKQVGNLIYMVKDLNTLNAIITEQELIGSILPEMNPYTKTKQNNYVCFSRSKNPAARNINRWKYGIILDGDKLSDRYSFKPIDYLNASKSNLRVKTLKAYDNDTYTVEIANRGTISITKDIFKIIEQEILNAADDFNKEHKLEIRTGARKFKGRMALRVYDYRVPHGGIHLETIDNSSLQNFIRDFYDETEERVWLKPPTDISACVSRMNIKGSIIGLYLPEFEKDNNEVIEFVQNHNYPVKWYKL